MLRSCPGIAPAASGRFDGPSFDTRIADAIGTIDSLQSDRR